MGGVSHQWLRESTSASVKLFMGYAGLLIHVTVQTHSHDSRKYGSCESQTAINLRESTIASLDLRSN